MGVTKSHINTKIQFFCLKEQFYHHYDIFFVFFSIFASIGK